jgi:ribosomal protein S7
MVTASTAGNATVGTTLKVTVLRGAMREHMPSMEIASLTIGGTGLIVSIGEVLTWTPILFFD